MASNTIRVRLPGAQDTIDVEYTAGGDVGAAVNGAAARLGTLRHGGNTAMVLTKRDGSRAVVRDAAQLAAVQQPGDVLEFWAEPELTSVTLHSSASGAAPQSVRVLLDRNVELSAAAPLVAAQMERPQPIVFAHGDRWLRLNLPLSAQRVPSGAALTAFSTSALCGPTALAIGGNIDDPSRPAADPSVATVHRTWLAVQARVRAATRLSSRKEHYAVLKDHLLMLYDNESAAVPTQVVALELFVALSITLSANRKAIVLRRGNRQDMSNVNGTSGSAAPAGGESSGGDGDVDFYLIQPKSDELQREWSALLRERALSGHKVFGVPLDELLERQQHKPPVPKLVEALVGYLDVNAIPAAVPRLLLAAPRSAALVQVLRDDADHGRSLELQKVRDPHAVAALLVAFFAELPEPLCGYEAYESWSPHAGDSSAICECVSRLELDRFILLKYLCSFLKRVVDAVPDVSVTEFATVFAPAFMRPRDPEQDQPQTHQKTIEIAHFLIDQHRKLYTLKDGKKMRLEFKSQRQPPKVQLDLGGGAPGAARRPTAARPLSGAGVRAPAEPRAPGAAASGSRFAGLSAAALVGAMRERAASDAAACDDVKTAVLFLRKNLLTWLKRRGVEPPADLAGGGAPGMSLEKIDALAQLVAQLEALGAQHGAGEKLEMVRKSLVLALPLA